MTRRDFAVTGRTVDGVFMWIPWSMLHCFLQQSYEGYVATATKRSPRFCEAQLDPSHGTGAWALQELCDDFFVLERFSICTSEQDRCKKEAVVLRLETAFMAPDATPSLKYRGISYLRQNGFAATL